MDWLTDFKSKFSDDEDLKDLAMRRFYGSITINFQEGQVSNVDIKQHKIFNYGGSSVTHTV
jgi:hypothetical protein